MSHPQKNKRNRNREVHEVGWKRSRRPNLIEIISATRRYVHWGAWVDRWKGRRGKCGRAFCWELRAVRASTLDCARSTNSMVKARPGGCAVARTTGGVDAWKSPQLERGAQAEGRMKGNVTLPSHADGTRAEAFSTETSTTHAPTHPHLHPLACGPLPTWAPRRRGPCRHRPRQGSVSRWGAGWERRPRYTRLDW